METPHGKFWCLQEYRFTVEVCTAMTAASIPCLKPLFRTIFASSSAADSTSRNNEGYIRNVEDASTNKETGGFEMYSRARNVGTIAGDFRNKAVIENSSKESILRQKSSESDMFRKATNASLSMYDLDDRGL